jgi:hypothetical protein
MSSGEKGFEPLTFGVENTRQFCKTFYDYFPLQQRWPLLNRNNVLAARIAKIDYLFFP